MRNEMIWSTKSQAMVCIGGMEGVEDELDIYRRVRPNSPIFVLEKTGGAAALVAVSRNDVRRIDVEVTLRLSDLRTKAHLLPDLEQHDAELRQPVTPYPLIMQTIVDEIANEPFQTF